MEQNVRVGLENSSPIICESCGGDTFSEATYLRKISKLLTIILRIKLFSVKNLKCVLSKIPESV